MWVKTGKTEGAFTEVQLKFSAFSKFLLFWCPRALELALGILEKVQLPEGWDPSRVRQSLLILQTTPPPTFLATGAMEARGEQQSLQPPLLPVPSSPPAA